MSRKNLKNSKPSNNLFFHECAELKIENQPEGGTTVPKFSFVGYSGGPVNLASYGFDAPVYYNVSGISTKQKIPVLYEHSTPIGHTTEIRKVDNARLEGKAVASFPSPEKDQVVEAINNDYPFESSMGLRVDDLSAKNVVFVKEGEKKTINNRDVTGPAYEILTSNLREMTTTTFGRDSETSFQALNKEQLMLIKNSGGPTTENKPEETTILTPFTPAPAPAPVVQNSAPDFTSTFRVARLLNSYPQHLEAIDKMFTEEKLSVEQVENRLKLIDLENRLPTPPTPEEKRTRNTDLANSITARLALAVGVKPEFLSKKLDKKVVDNAHDSPMLGMVETALMIANSHGEHFSGISDKEQLFKWCKEHSLNNSGFSTFDMPNLFERVSKLSLEERWEMNPPFAPQHLKEESNTDFKPTQRVRPGGGEPWGSLDAKGKIDLTHFGQETMYTSRLDTVAQLLVIDRQTAINDDMGVLSELMDAMIEGAMMVPDMKLGQKMLVQAAAANTFWVNADNSRTGVGLSRTNLSTLYQAARQYTESRGGKNWVQVINDRWKLIVSLTKEETAWDILKQDRVVSNTTANTIQGDKNYWFNRMDLAVFPQMGNTSLYGSTSAFVSEETYLLWPSSPKYAPYSITYLLGQKRPVIESVALPENMLGWGQRGYWDVEINERERTAVIRAKN